MSDPTPTPAPAPQGTPGEGTPANGTPPANGGTPPTILAGEPAKGGEPAPPAGKWYGTYAEADEKRRNVLDRYAGMSNLLDAHFALKQRVDSGELKAVKALPKDANSQEVAAWRKDNGVPENAGDYLTNMPNGLVIGEQDKPALLAISEGLHKANVPAQYVHAMVASYNAWQESQAAEVAKADQKLQRETEDALRAEWGNNFRANVGAGKEFLVNTAGQELADDIMEAVLPDGSRIGDNVKALKWLAQAGREMNPIATIPGIGGDGGGSGATVDAEIAKIEKFMRTNRRDYDRDPAMQERFMKLIEARDRLRKKSA